MKFIHNLILILSLCTLFVNQLQASEKSTIQSDLTKSSLTTISYQKVENSEVKKQREELILALTQRQEAFEVKYYVLVGFTLFLVLLFGVLCFLNKRGDKRLEKIISLLEKHKKESASNEKENNEQQLDIDEAIVTMILENLRTFEAERGFLVSKITLHQFAKKMKTNTKYLSKVVNTYKSKSFRNYINDLRIQYSIQRLQNHKKYRKYTLNAMATEAGFSTRESFTKAFRKKTGTTVSSFVSQLNEIA